MGHEERGERVLRAAATVFAARGFHQASVREIASEAGISLAGLYYYVPSKADLLSRIAANAFDALLENLDDALTQVNGPEERLRAFIQNHLDFFLGHMDEMKVISREVEFLTGESQAVVAEKRKRYYLGCVGILDELQGSKGSREDLRIPALALFGMINWIHAWYRPGRDGDAKRLADEMTRLFLRGFLGVERKASGSRKDAGDAAAAFMLAWNVSKSKPSIPRSDGRARPDKSREERE